MTDLIDHANRLMKYIDDEHQKPMHIVYTATVDVVDSSVEGIELLIQEELTELLRNFEGSSYRLHSFEITPLQTTSRNVGSDSMGEYDYEETHRGVVITLIGIRRI